MSRTGGAVAVLAVIVGACSSGSSGPTDAGNSAANCGASPPVIYASSYDQSCSVDSDCLAVYQGNSCDPCDFSCTNAAINRMAYSKYTADTADLPAVLAAQKGQCASSCGLLPGPCCVCGTCREGDQCAAVEGITDGGLDGGADAHQAECDCYAADACPADCYLLRIYSGSLESFCSGVNPGQSAGGGSSDAPAGG